MRGSSPRMTRRKAIHKWKILPPACASGMKEGWSGPSRPRGTKVLTRWCEGAPPRCFLEVTFTSRASGCFEAVPAQHSTPGQRQPVHDCLQAPALSPHSRRHPDSASFTEQGEEWLPGIRNAVKRKIVQGLLFSRPNTSWPGLTRPSPSEDSRVKPANDGLGSPAMTLFVVRHARARPAHLPLARDGRIDPRIKSGD